jgi:hypothetical protein
LAALISSKILCDGYRDGLAAFCFAFLPGLNLRHPAWPAVPQFLCAVNIEVGKLQDLWAQASGIPGTRAKELFNRELGDLIFNSNQRQAWYGSEFDLSRKPVFVDDEISL